MEQKRWDNIILIGFMGAGKTTVGKYLAKELNYRFLDTDQVIETMENMTINRIFEVQGEEYFRNLETSLLKSWNKTLKDSVLSTGGGLPIRPENGRLLRKLGLVIYLKTSKETVISRLKGDSTRPLLSGEELETKVDRLLGIRDPIYRAVAHHTIETDHRQKEEIADLIKRICQENYQSQ